MKCWCSGRKEGKKIIRPTEESIKRGIVKNKEYIYSNELYYMYQILKKYLDYIILNKSCCFFSLLLNKGVVHPR